MPYLFDGYNLYHAFRKVAEEFQSITPRLLCELIAQDMSQLRDKATVVFDGHPLRGQFDDATTIGSVTIAHSRSESDADTVLENMIKENSAPRRLTVVSSDNRIRRAARRRRATSLSSADYIEKALKRLSNPPKRQTEPREKRQGTAPGQTDEWLKLFGMDTNDPPDDPLDQF